MSSRLPSEIGYHANSAAMCSCSWPDSCRLQLGGHAYGFWSQANSEENYGFIWISGFQADFYFYTVSLRTVFKGSSALFKGSSSKIQSKKLRDPSRLREAADIMCSSLGAFTSGGTFGFDWKWPGNLQSYPIVKLRNQRSLDLKGLQKL